MPVNDTTTNRSYQKPNIANTLADDVGRLRSALDAIDADMAGVVREGDSGTVTSTMIADGAIVNGDVSASAAIAGSKIAPDFGAQDITTSGNVLLTGTGYVDLPIGTTAQRPGTPNSGMVRYNSTLGIFEGYGSSWKRLDNAATGGGSDEIFYENGQTVTTNYTLTSGKNAMSAGPITINNGITVTVPSGSSWSIV